MELFGCRTAKKLFGSLINREYKNMSEKIELCFCKSCTKEKQHILVLVRKEDPFKDAKENKKKILLLV